MIYVKTFERIYWSSQTMVIVYGHTGIVYMLFGGVDIDRSINNYWDYYNQIAGINYP